MRFTRLVQFAMLVALGGCITAKTPSASKGGNESVVTQEQLLSVNSDNLYDALTKLRPEWFTSRGANSASDISESVVSIYIGGSLLGKAQSLRDLRILDVASARFWNAGQASARFGMGHPRGVIELIRR